MVLTLQCSEKIVQVISSFIKPGSLLAFQVILRHLSHAQIHCSHITFILKCLCVCVLKRGECVLSGGSCQPSHTSPLSSERRAKVKTKQQATQLASSCPGGNLRAETACVTMATPGLLTKSAGPMAPNTQGQIAGPFGRPGVRAGRTCSPCSLGLFGAMFFMRKGFSEAGLFLVGFLPAGGSQVFYSHIWLLDLKLLQTR